MTSRMSNSMVFFFNDTATTEIYTLSLHDALPISGVEVVRDKTRSKTGVFGGLSKCLRFVLTEPIELLRGTIKLTCRGRDRKSTRLNSSHANISYAVFCLKKKK